MLLINVGVNKTVVYIRFINVFVVMALICSIAFCLQLNITVEDSGKTKLYDTTVEVLRGNEVIASKLSQRVHTMRTGEYAMAQFSLEPGFYFVRLKRASYPEHIVSMLLTENIQKQLVMVLKKSSYTLYGQIIDEPIDKWQKSKVYVIDEKDAAVRSNIIQQNGYYSIESLDPAKTYRLRIGDGENKKMSAPFKYEGEGAYYLQINLSKDNTNVEDTATKITSAQSAVIGQQINVYLKYGQNATANQTIEVITPKGKTTIISDDEGIARIGAADYGEYVFEWKEQKTTTTVKDLREKEQIQIQNDSQNKDNIPVNKTEKKNLTQPQNNALVFGLGFSLFIGAIVGIVIVAIIAYYLWNKQKNNKKSK